MRLIDADELLEKHTCDVYGAYDDSCMVQAVFAPYIKGAPTIEAAPVVHGRWIPIEYDGYADGYPVWDLWECSECREEHSGDEDTLTPYCPNCGAKMDKGDGDG